MTATTPRIDFCYDYYRYWAHGLPAAVCPAGPPQQTPQLKTPWGRANCRKVLGIYAVEAVLSLDLGQELSPRAQSPHRRAVAGVKRGESAI